jgi:PAS domain S-box-containing protein
MARILIVEDRQPDREFLTSLFGHSGHTVLEASDGIEALGLVEQQRPDLVISDILMPRMDGYEFVRVLRDIRGLRDVPVIFYTANYHEREARALAETCGVTDVLTKPTEPSAILARVDAVLTGNRPHGMAPPPGGQFDRDHAAVVGAKLLEKVRGLEESEQRVATLVEIGQQIASVRDLTPLLQHVCAFGREMTFARQAVLGVVSENGAAIDTILSSGFETPISTEAWTTVLDGDLFRPLLANRHVVHRLNPTGLPEAFGFPATHPKIFSLLAVPLMSPSQVWGWLILLNKVGADSFTDADAQAAGTLGAQAGIAFENVRLVEQLRRHTVILEQEVVNRTQAEAQARANEDRFRQLADAMPQIVWTANADGVIDYFNRRWFDFTGFSDQQSFAPDGWLALLHPDDAVAYQQTWSRAVASGESHQMEYRFRDRTAGAFRWFLGRALPVKAGDGRIVKWFGTCTDIDEQKGTERQLREANRIRDEFLQVVSHELRTPLNAVLGWSRMLTVPQIASRQADRALATIQRNAQALTHLVDDLLDVARVIAGNEQLNAEAVNFADVVEEAADSIRLAAEMKKIAFTADLDRTGALVHGDFKRLKQVVWNLLSNAVKFTSAGGRVQVRLESDETHTRLSVSDTGIGIAAAFLPFAFERFRQADATSTRERGGLGLGLAIARHLVELHGGTIRAESVGEGQGSTFTVELPILVGQPEKRRMSRKTPESLKWTPGAHAGGARLHGLTILLVDDDTDTRDLYEFVLQNAGASVVAVASAAAAVERLSTERFSVLISDVAMPVEDGYSLIARVRAAETDHARIPAIAVTGFARAEDRTRALASGFQQCLSKPIDPMELVVSVAALVQRTL